MDLSQKVKFPDTVFAQEVDGEMVLLDMNTENYFGLDEVGTSIWQAIEENEGELQKVFRALLDQYDVEEDVLKKDLSVFVDKLAESGLVTVLRNEC
ncbi:PqqD family protein [Sulfurovum sp. ST-21]|uniref:PqqD family protein n=1 Tax=Sulfurovum indicum TaxID=2779528 RepID=A0A7M1S4K8_9BACT|nr:PqqD family protein [Sulfurovum indicum]QOR62256.1 PqqD family protein [Sulfurovum indicum]